MTAARLPEAWTAAGTRLRRRVTARLGVNAGIAVFSLTLIGVVYVSVLANSDSERQKAIDSAIRQNSNLALAIEEHTIRTLKGVDAVTLFLKHDFERHGINIDLTRYLENSIIDGKLATAISVFDERGRMVASTHPVRPGNFSGREHYAVHPHSDSGQMYVSRPEVGLTSGEWSIYLTRRINKADGRFGGVLSMTVDPHYFTNFYQQTDLGQKGLVSLIGFDGITRARQAGRNASFGQDVSGSRLMAEQAKKPVGGFLSDGSLESVRRYTSFRTVAGYPLIVVVGTAQDEVLAGYWQQRDADLGAAGLFSAVIVCFSALLMIAVRRQKRAVVALAASNTQFRATFEQAAVGIAHVELDGRFMRVNQKLCDMLGYARGELLALTVVDITHPEERGIDRKRRAYILAGDLATYSVERRCLRKNGTVIWVNRTVSLVCDAAGKPAYYIRVMEDITERKKAEERFRATFEQAAVGISHTTFDRRFLHVNQKFCDMLGYTRDELLAMRSNQIAAADDQAPGADNRRAIEGEIDTYAGEKRYIRKDGSLFWGYRTVSLARDEAGKPLYFIQVVEDISARKNAEEHLRRVARARKVMAECRRVLVHADDETRLLHDMCMTALEFGGYRHAWVGYAEHDDRKSVYPVAQAGIDKSALERAHISWGEGEYGQGASGRTIRTGKPTLVRDVFAGDEFRLWQDMAREQGVVSTITLPLVGGGTTFGILKIHAGEVDAFDAEEITLLEEIAADLAYGIVSLRARADHKRAQAALEVNEELMRSIFDNAAVGIIITSPGQRYLQVNDKYCDIAGYAREELLGMLNTDVLVAQSVPTVIDNRRKLIRGEVQNVSGERQLIRKNRSLIWIHQSTSLARDPNGEPRHFITVVTDISERKRAEEQLTYLAHHDTLTALPNRELFYDRLRHALEQAQRRNWIVGVMFVDLDRFKAVNDTLGHNAGDELLRQVGARLARCVRADDTVGRLGGDEFALILAELARVEDAGLVAQKVIAAIAAPFMLEGHEFFVTASIGIATYPGDADTAAALLKNADAAMYRVKGQGKNNYQFYAATMNVRAAESLQLENDLRYAIQRDEFVLHFQPKADLATGSITGVEALLRWQRSDGRLVPPAEFIPLLEESGLIVPAGEWVLRAACAQICAWRKAGLAPVPIAVNLSARQFHQQNICAMVQGALEQYHVEAQLLELEITESAAMHDAEAATTMLRDLKAIGVRIAIDDFGTGYSSLSYLKRFPIDSLKIDRSFITELPGNRGDASIAKAVITMAHALGLKVVAEGVENEAQLTFLALHACDEIQGYYFSRPLSAELCTQFMEEARALPGLAATGRSCRPQPLSAVI